MKIIICGAGQVGLGIAKKLSQENNDVTIIDSDPDRVKTYENSLDVKVIIGHGSDPDVLHKAQASQASMIIAVTQEDEVNMLACQVAHVIFNVPTKIARIRLQSYLKPEWQEMFVNDRIPIDVIISPEVEIGKAILRRLAIPGAFEVMSFGHENIKVVGFTVKEECAIRHITLKELGHLFPDLQARIIGIMRKGKVFLPSGRDFVYVGDQIYVAVNPNHMMRLLNIMGYMEHSVKNILIAGGGKIGSYIAHEIERIHPRARVRLIERHQDQARLLSESLTRTLIIHGSSLDISALEEASVQDTQTMVAVTDDDRTNILSCALAKRAGCGRSMALISDKVFKPFGPHFGIDSMIDPQANTLSTILRYVRRGRIKSLYSVFDGLAEIMEVEVLNSCPIIGIPLKEARIPQGILIGAILRQHNIIIPNGETCVYTGDVLVVFVAIDCIQTAERLFRASVDFF